VRIGRRCAVWSKNSRRWWNRDAVLVRRGRHFDLDILIEIRGGGWRRFCRRRPDRAARSSAVASQTYATRSL
jgi:hypothetical protein